MQEGWYQVRIFGPMEALAEALRRVYDGKKKVRSYIID
jgi:hypothetical protein